MEKTCFDDEVELKKFLDSNYCVRYGELGYNDFFIISYRDNKAGTIILRQIFESPISAVREIQSVIQQTKLPISDIDIVIEFTFNPVDLSFNKVTTLEKYVILSPYLYFKKPEEKTDNKDSENKE